MSDGMRNFGAELRNLGRAIKGIRIPQQPVPQAPQVNTQELTYAKQVFNRQFYEWQANAAGMRFDRVQGSYEEFLGRARNDLMGSDLFTDDVTREAFSYWMEEAGAQRRVPVAEQAVAQRAEYNRGLYDANYNGAVEAGDPQLLVESVYAAVEQGTIIPDEAMNEIDAGMYQINLRRVHDSIMEYAREFGFDAAVEQLNSLSPDSEQFQYQVGLTEDGEPNLRSMSEDDFQGILDQVRGELDEQRQEEKYRIDQADQQADKIAQSFFADTSRYSLLQFKTWLYGTDPMTGNGLDDASNPRVQMLPATWRTWDRLVNAALTDLDREATQAERDAADAAYRQFLIEHARMVEEDIPQEEINEETIRAFENNPLWNPEDIRTLVNYNEARNENPILESVQRYIGELTRQYQVNAAVAGEVEEAFLRWFRDDAVQMGQDGRPVYNIDRTSREDQRTIAENIFYSIASQHLEDQARAAYQIRDDQIVPSVSRGAFLQTDRGSIDDAERLQAAIQRGEYLGWDQMQPQIRRQLGTLWQGQARMFEEITGFRPTNSIDLDAKGYPIFTQSDATTGRTSYFRFKVPTNEEGEVTVPVLGGQANEYLQVWDPDLEAWRKVRVTNAGRAGTLGNVRFIIDTDSEADTE